MVAAINRTHNAMAASSEPAAAEDESDISTLIARLTAEVDQIACEKARSIQQITNQMKMLALNALIESSRAGALGAGFGVVAQEVRSVGQKVETISRELETPAHQADRQPDALDRTDDRAFARRAHGRSGAERHRADRPEPV